MRYSVAFPRLKAAALCAAVAGLAWASLPAFAPSAQAAEAPPKMSAVYQMRFAGLKVGKFKLWTSVDKSRYAMRGSGKITFLTKMLFELTGGTASSGQISSAGATPAAFSFNFRTKKKTGQMVMKFDDGAVSHVASQPAIKPHPKAVPVKAKHVSGVLDPLSALFFATKASHPRKPSSVCDRRIPVYDGLYRFDLQLSHKNTVRVVSKSKNKNGYSGPAVICRVKFIPVAGHRPHTSVVAFMSQTDDIEVWLMPVPRTAMYVPYHVSLPTPYGTAQMTSTAFQVQMADRTSIALVR